MFESEIKWAETVTEVCGQQILSEGESVVASLRPTVFHLFLVSAASLWLVVL